MYNVGTRDVAVFFNLDFNIDILHPPRSARELRRDLRPDLMNRLRSMLLRSFVPGPLQGVNPCQALFQRRAYRVNRNLAFHVSGRLGMTEVVFGEWCRPCHRMRFSGRLRCGERDWYRQFGDI